LLVERVLLQKHKRVANRHRFWRPSNKAFVAATRV